MLAFEEVFINFYGLHLNESSLGLRVLKSVYILLSARHSVKHVEGDRVDGVYSISVYFVVILKSRWETFPRILILEALCMYWLLHEKSGSCSRSMRGTSKAFLALTFWMRTCLHFWIGVYGLLHIWHQDCCSDVLEHQVLLPPPNLQGWLFCGDEFCVSSCDGLFLPGVWRVRKTSLCVFAWAFWGGGGRGRVFFPFKRL